VDEVRRSLAAPGGPIARLSARRAPKSRHGTKAALKAWAAFDEDGGLLTKLAQFRLPPPDRASVRVPWTDDEWIVLIYALKARSTPVPTPVRACLLILAERGLRAGDVLRMSRAAIVVAMRTGRLRYVGKRSITHEIRTEPLKVYLQALLDEGTTWKTVVDLVVPNAGNPAKRGVEVLNRWVKRIAKLAGLEPTEAHTHRFRRTRATQVDILLNGDLGALCDFFGWSSVQMARNYTDHSRFSKHEEIEKKLKLP